MRSLQKIGTVVCASIIPVSAVQSFPSSAFGISAIRKTRASVSAVDEKAVTFDYDSFAEGRYFKEGKVAAVTPSYLDVDQDSEFSINDCVLTARYCTEDRAAVMKRKPDINGNGNTDTEDLRYMIRFAALCEQDIKPVTDIVCIPWPVTGTETGTATTATTTLAVKNTTPTTAKQTTAKSTTAVKPSTTPNTTAISAATTTVTTNPDIPDWRSVTNPDGAIISRNEYNTLCEFSLYNGIQKFDIVWTGGSEYINNSVIVLTDSIANELLAGGAFRLTTGTEFYNNNKALFDADEEYTFDDVRNVKQSEYVLWRVVDAAYLEQYPDINCGRLWRFEVDGEPQDIYFTHQVYFPNYPSWLLPQWALIPK